MYALDSNEAGATFAVSYRHGDTASALDSDRAPPRHLLARPDDVTASATVTEPDLAELARTATNPEPIGPRTGSPSVRDSAQLFAAADEPEAPAGLTFEMEELKRAVDGDGGEGQCSWEGDDREAGDNGR